MPCAFRFLNKPPYHDTHSSNPNGAPSLEDLTHGVGQVKPNKTKVSGVNKTKVSWVQPRTIKQY